MKNPIQSALRILTAPIRWTVGLFRSKYTEIILAVGLFILLDTGVLIINFYTSYQIANDAHAIQLASKMGTLSQSLLHQLYQVYDDVSTRERSYDNTVDQLADTYNVFDETLDAFIYGGELIGKGQEKDALLEDTVYRDTSANLLTDAEHIWKEYRVKLKPIVFSYFSDITRDELLDKTREAITYSRKHCDELLELMQSFALAVEGVAQRKAERLRMIQSAGITLAVINFFLILFHFLRRLRKSDVLVEKSRRETENILQNVSEGLFLLDRNFTIGSQHSASLHDLFHREKLAGRNFIDLLGGIVSEKTLDTVKDYTEILFSQRVNASLVKDLNPLDQVEVNFTNEGAVLNLRYFSFQFSRVQESKDVQSLLVTVKDISEQVQLAGRLKAANEKASREIDMLLTIIHLDSINLANFLQSTGDGLDDVNVILKSPAKPGEKLEDKLIPISRVIHKLKGDSTAIGLDFLVDKFHRFEAEINTLKERTKLKGEDFLPLVVALKQLISDFLVIEKLTEKMGAMDTLAPISRYGQVAIANNKPWQHPAADDSRWVQPLRTLVATVARDCEKQANLDLSKFDPKLLSRSQEESVRDIVIQTLRNAVTHGLENPAERERAGKPREGRLQVELSRNGAGLSLKIRDDGKGIDLQQIKEAAAAKGVATREQLDKMERNKLIALLFTPGFSTIDKAGLHAGQGVGMDLVKSRIKAMKGRIKLCSQKGAYTEFQYIFAPETAAIQ